MNNLNEVHLIGRVGSDPEVFKSSDDKKNIKFSLATSETWKDKEKTEWHKIVVYREKLAQFIETYVKKGSLVYLSGKLKYGKWEDSAGISRTKTEIVIDMINGKLLLLNKKDGNVSNELHHTESNSEKDELDDIPEF